MESNELKKIEDELKVYDVAYFKNNKPSELFLDGELFLDSLEEAINESWQEMKFRYEDAAEKLVKEFIKDGYLIEFKIKEEFIKDLKEFWNL